MKGKKLLVGLTGGVIGTLAVVLVLWGNPANMGYCIACFLRDIAGGLGYHRAAPVQYIRPEILGMVIGAFGAAMLTREFKSSGGSSPLARFFIAFAAMIGMLVFLGCPVRAVLRLAGGDLNALVGIAGLAVGIAVGIYFLNKGFSLGRATAQHSLNGHLFPLATLVLTILVLLGVQVFFTSQEGPGSMHAPVLLALGAGIVVGVLAQRSRFCMIGGVRDFILFKDLHLLIGFMAMFVFALAGNLITGMFNPGFIDQPVAHNDGVWNFLGMVLAGTGVTLLGGCPLRQLIAASEGNTDCVITVLGLIAGAAFAHNFGLAASPAGVPVAGQWAVVLGLIVVLGIGFWGIKSINVPGGVKIEQNN